MAGLAQTKVKPGLNLFSVQDDVAIGRRAAAEVERQLPILRDRSTQAYIRRLGQRLAAMAPGADFPYQFRVTDVSDINAFALPGGFMYVNRGLIEAAESEAELAGVMAHEIAHVALRHGTNQVSKAYLTRSGLGLIGALLGGRGAAADIINNAGGFGLNALFLKFSRTAEKQADIVGAQMLAKAGYDPLALADFFRTLEEQSSRDPGALEAFFSTHPPPADRARRIREEARLLTVRTSDPVGDFEAVTAGLQDRRPAASSPPRPPLTRRP